MASTPKRRPGELKTLGISLLVVGWLSVPVIALMFTPVSAGAGVAASSMIGVGLAAALGGPRWGLLIMIWSIFAVGIAPVGLLYPALGVVLIACMGASTGLAASRGLQAPVMMTNLVTAMMMLNPPALTQSQVAGGIEIDVTYTFTLMLIVAVGAIWACASMLVIRTKVRVPPLAPLQREKAIVYGASLAFLTGVSGAVALTWFPYTLAGWTILTIYIIFRAEFLANEALRGMRIKITQRALGTIGGIIIAGGLALVLPNPNALIICGLLLATLAASRMFAGAAYWQFVILLTPAMVLLDSNGLRVDSAALTRLLCTAIGIAAAVAVMEFNRLFTFPWIRDSQAQQRIDT